MSGIGESATFRISPPHVSGSRIWMICWNHDGSLMASCGEDKIVRIWSHEKGTSSLKCVTQLDDTHTRAVRCVNFSNCGKFLASASFDASIAIYQIENGEFCESNKLEGHESEVKWCAFSPSDEFLATCSRDKSVWFWQMDEDDDFQVSSILQPHTQDVKFVVWHPTEELLLSCSYDYSIRLFKYDGEDWVTQQKIEKAHEGTVWCADFNTKGDKIVTVGEDHCVKIWRRNNETPNAVGDTWKFVCSHRIEDTRWPFYTVSWNKVTGLIAVGGGDGRIRIFHLSGDGDEVCVTQDLVIEEHEGDVNCVSWCPSDPTLIASCGDDGCIKFTNIVL